MRKFTITGDIIKLDLTREKLSFLHIIFRLTKEYNWNVKNKASKGYEENFFFCYRPGAGVYYNELETRVRLSKRVKGE